MKQHDISGMSWVVTEHDIERGYARICSDCPHARALNRFPGPISVWRVRENWANRVGGIFTNFRLEIDWFRLRQETRQWIKCFDRGEGWGFESLLPGLHCSEPMI